MYRPIIPPAILLLAFAPCAVAQNTYDATIVGDIGLRQVCNDQVIPVLKIRNSGSETMSGCVVETWKNGFMVGSFDWQLAVPAATGQLRQPAFPAVTDVVPGDEIEMRIISVNTHPDQGPEGNTRTIVVGDEPPVATTYLAEVHLTTTAQAEVDWILRNAQGAAVAQRTASVLVPGQDQVVWVELAPASCYSVEVVDVGGTGFEGALLTVRCGGEPVVTVGPAEVQSGTRPGFSSGVAATVPDMAAGGTISLGWSMTEHRLRVADGEQGPATLMVLDGAGRLVHQASLLLGDQVHTIDMEHLASGSYVAVVRQREHQRSLRLAQVR